MAYDLTEPTLGFIVTPITWDGVDFHPLLSTLAGLLEVSIQEVADVIQVDVDSLRGHDDVIPMHYHSQWRKRFFYTVDAGQSYVVSTAVPAGMVAVVTNLNMWTSDVLTTVVVSSVQDGVDNTFVYRDGAPAANIPYSWTGILYLDAGDYILADQTGCPIGGSVYLDVSAYLMRIP